MGDEKTVVNPPAAGANQLFHVFNEANAGISVYMVDYNEALVLDADILAEWRSENGDSVLAGPTDGEAKTER